MADVEFSLFQPVRGGPSDEILGHLILPARELAAVHSAARQAEAERNGHATVVLSGARLLGLFGHLPYIEDGDPVRRESDLAVLRDFPAESGEAASVQAEIHGRHVSFLGASESKTFRSAHPIPLPEFDLLVVGISPTDRVPDLMAWCARTHPFSLARALDDYPDGEYGLLAPLRHTFPEGLPASVFQAMLESEVQPLREAAVKALRVARPSPGRSR